MQRSNVVLPQPEGNDRSFEEKLAGVINYDLGTTSHAIVQSLKNVLVKTNGSKPANVAAIN